MAHPFKIQKFRSYRLPAVLAGAVSFCVLILSMFNIVDADAATSVGTNPATVGKLSGVVSTGQSESQIREIDKLVPAGPNSVCRDLKIEAHDVNGKWVCLNLDFVASSEQLSTLQILQSSLDVAQKNDATSTYLYRMTGVRHHGFRVKSVKLIKHSK